MFSFLEHTRNRQYGLLPQRPWRESMFSSLYKSFLVSSCTETTPSNGQDWGAVFGLGFSPDGSLMAAACENSCLLMYDPHNAKLITRRFGTHDNCVNCVSFLDNRVFATCSDDNTVRLWDARHMKKEFKVIRGHTNCVKNINYCSSTGKLITSGFDGNVFAWDVNKYSEQVKPESILRINGLLRFKLCPDEKRMILSTLSGYLILINNLDIDHIMEDLRGFGFGLSPLVYFATQPVNKHRNVVELISDFPTGDDPESINSLEVHPEGWCVLSRNITVDEQAEWTCVHDIRDRTPETCTRRSGRKRPWRKSNISTSSENSSDAAYSRNVDQAVTIQSSNSSQDVLNSQTDDATIQSYNSSQDVLNSQTDDVTIQSSNRSQDILSSQTDDEDHSASDNWSPSSPPPPTYAAFIAEPRMTYRLLPAAFTRHHRHRPRLLMFSEEPNVGQGFIKEQSFSPDGRIIASPFGNCVRLLACEPSSSQTRPVQPQPLRQVGLTAGNRSYVLTTVFSPQHMLYASGSEDGSVSFCSPRL